MTNFHSVKFGCGCTLCQQPKPFYEYPGDEINDAKQEAYRASRRVHAESVGRPIERMRIRGADLP